MNVKDELHAAIRHMGNVASVLQREDHYKSNEILELIGKVQLFTNEFEQNQQGRNDNNE